MEYIKFVLKQPVSWILNVVDHRVYLFHRPCQCMMVDWWRYKPVSICQLCQLACLESQHIASHLFDQTTSFNVDDEIFVKSCSNSSVKIMRPQQTRLYLTHKGGIFLKENVYIMIQISLDFIQRVQLTTPNHCLNQINKDLVHHFTKDGKCSAFKCWSHRYTRTSPSLCMHIPCTYYEVQLTTKYG